MNQVLCAGISPSPVTWLSVIDELMQMSCRPLPLAEEKKCNPCCESLLAAGNYV